MRGKERQQKRAWRGVERSEWVPLATLSPCVFDSHVLVNPSLPTQITSEAAFAAHIASAPVVVADFMARWCRKCIYVKPRLATLMSSKFKNVPIAFVDVNAVPSAVVRGAGVSKMPTICVYVHGEQVDAYVAGESATTAVLKLESMIEAALKKAKDGAPAK